MNDQQQTNKATVKWITITEDNSEQRLDNFLITLLKGVPKTRLYRIIRKGEVRVNKGRVDNKYRLKIGDIVRIPPVRVSAVDTNIILQPRLKKNLEQDILYEDEVLIVLNKPSGFAVHGGSGISSGVIEGIRLLRPESRFLELVHRLDKETSGCLLIAKKRSALKVLHDLFREDKVSKTYLALLIGQWKQKKLWVNQPLLRNMGKSGERIVKVNKDGKPSETLFKRLQQFEGSTLIEATPKTGRTHQIRVHAAWLGHPIVGDDRYGHSEANQVMKKKGYKRMFLHAEQIQFAHPVSNNLMKFKAPLSVDLESLLNKEVLLK